MEKRSNEMFETRVKWKVYNKEFKEISKFSFSAFSFKFKIKSQIHQQEFTELIFDKEGLLPSDICNFFLNRDIHYSLSFKYIKGIRLRSNLKLFNHVIFLNKQKLRILIREFVNNYRVSPSIKREMINGRNRLSFLLEVFNIKRRKIYFVQADSNIWWKPKKTVETYDKGSLISFGWLFVQIGKMIIN